MTNFKRLLVALIGIISLGSPVLADKDYELKINRFNDTKTATYKSYRRNCTILKSSVDELLGCNFLHGTDESGGYVSLVSFYSSESWELLEYRSLNKANVIITFSNEEVRRQTLPIPLIDGDVMSEGSVLEYIGIRLDPIKDELINIKQIEFQIGLHEFMWKPNSSMTKKALNFEE